jgi:hypothetical protein
VDSGDHAGSSLAIGPLTETPTVATPTVNDLIVGAPDAAGPSNSRSGAGEVYVLWGAVASRSLGAADVTIFGAHAGDRLGADLSSGDTDKVLPADLAMLASNAGAAGEIHLILGRARSAFSSTLDLASESHRQFIGDSSSGSIQKVLVYDHTGEGARDIVAGMPSAASGAGAIEVSYSPVRARVTGPAAPLNSSSVTFTWDAGVRATAYWLDVSVVRGGGEIFSGYMGASRAYTVNNVPLGQGTIWVRVRSLIDGAYQSEDASFSTITPQPAQLTAPAAGATLAQNTQTFSWDEGLGVSGYWLDVGTTRGSNDIYQGYQGQSHSATISGIPLTGSLVWVRLRSLINGQYQAVDRSFGTLTATAAHITSPAAGSTLTGSTQTFTWGGGVGVSYYWVNVGTTQGDYSLYSNYVGNTSAVTVSGLPINGQPIWVRLMSNINGTYRIVDHQFTAATPTPARVTSPTAGSTLAGETQLFTWSGGVGVSYYWVNVGTAPGDYSLYSNYVGNTTGVRVSGLPIDGRQIWVRLMSNIGGTYHIVDQMFTAATPGPARIASPAVGSVLSGATQMFTWNPGVGAQYYWVNVGRTQGGYELYSNYVGNTTAVQVAGLPIDGGPVWVRLMSYINGSYQWVDHRFTAATPHPSVLTSPAAEATLTGSTQTFTWDAGAGVSYYWIDIGRTQGGYELYSNYVGNTHAANIAGLPTDGGDIWVRLYSRIGDHWETVDRHFKAAQ